MAKTSSTRVITGKVRLSYVNIFEPTAFEEGDTPKYSVMLLIPKTDKKTIKKLRAAEEAALEAGKGKWGGKLPKNLNDSIIHDGDDEAEDFPEREGHWYMTVRSKDRPGVVDQDVMPIMDASEVYSGCYARVSLNAFAYATGANKGGVSFGLNNVQKLADGESLGGRVRAEDEFDVVDDDDDDLI